MQKIFWKKFSVQRDQDDKPGVISERGYMTNIILLWLFAMQQWAAGTTLEPKFQEKVLNAPLSGNLRVEEGEFHSHNGDTVLQVERVLKGEAPYSKLMLLVVGGPGLYPHSYYRLFEYLATFVPSFVAYVSVQRGLDKGFETLVKNVTELKISTTEFALDNLQLLKFIEREHGMKAYIHAHSYGTFVAQKMILHEPEIISKLLMEATVPLDYKYDVHLKPIRQALFDNLMDICSKSQSCNSKINKQMIVDSFKTIKSGKGMNSCMVAARDAFKQKHKKPFIQALKYHLDISLNASVSFSTILKYFHDLIVCVPDFDPLSICDPVPDRFVPLMGRRSVSKGRSDEPHEFIFSLIAFSELWGNNGIEASEDESLIFPPICLKNFPRLQERVSDYLNPPVEDPPMKMKKQDGHVIFISGLLDPSLVSDYGHEVGRKLSNIYSVDEFVFPTAGHNLSDKNVGCSRESLEYFLDLGEKDALLDCLAGHQTFPDSDFEWTVIEDNLIVPLMISLFVLFLLLTVGLLVLYSALKKPVIVHKV